MTAADSQTVQSDLHRKDLHRKKVHSELLTPVGPWYKICMSLSAHRIPSEHNPDLPEMDTVRRVLPQDIYYNASVYAADEAQLQQLLKAEKQRLGDQLFELMPTADSPKRDRGVHVALQGECRRQLSRAPVSVGMQER